jgi:hypothetical protein
VLFVAIPVLVVAADGKLLTVGLVSEANEAKLPALLPLTLALTLAVDVIERVGDEAADAVTAAASGDPVTCALVLAETGGRGEIDPVTLLSELLVIVRLDALRLVPDIVEDREAVAV